MANELDRVLVGEDSVSYGWDINSISDIVSQSDMALDERQQLDHIFSISDIKQALRTRLLKPYGTPGNKDIDGASFSGSNVPTHSLSTVVDDILPQKGLADRAFRHSIQTDYTVAQDTRSRMDDRYETQDRGINTSHDYKTAGVQTDFLTTQEASSCRDSIRPQSGLQSKDSSSKGSLSKDFQPFDSQQCRSQQCRSQQCRPQQSSSQKSSSRKSSSRKSSSQQSSSQQSNSQQSSFQKSNSQQSNSQQSNSQQSNSQQSNSQQSSSQQSSSQQFKTSHQSTPLPITDFYPSPLATAPFPSTSDTSDQQGSNINNMINSRNSINGEFESEAGNFQTEWLELRVHELEDQVREMQETIDNLRGSEPIISPSSMPDATKNIPDSKKKYHKLELDQIDEMTLSQAHNFIKKVVLLYEIPLSLIPETLCLIFDHLKDEDRYYEFARAVHRMLYNSDVPNDEIMSECLSKMTFEIERLHSVISRRNTDKSKSTK